MSALIPITDASAASLLRAADVPIEKSRLADHTGAPAAWHGLAPSWAVMVAGIEGANPRKRIVALRRMQRDPECRAWAATLLDCIDDGQRAQVIESVANEVGKTIVCRCGVRFQEASLWREHLEGDECSAA